MIASRIAEADLKLFAEDALFYDYYMLLAASRRIGIAESTSDEELSNIALESFLLHARILVEFFYVTPQPKRIGARHYLATPEQVEKWKASRSAISRILSRRTFGDLSVWLSHPSVGRTGRTGAKPGWKIPAMRAELASLLFALRDVLPPERQEWFSWAKREPVELASVVHSVVLNMEGTTTTSCTGTTIHFSARDLMGIFR